MKDGNGKVFAYRKKLEHPIKLDGNDPLFDGPWQRFNPKEVISHRAEMAFVNGLPLRQVHLEDYSFEPLPMSARSGTGTHTYEGAIEPEKALTPGTFGVTDRSDPNYVYVAPSGDVDTGKATVEVARYQYALEITGKRNLVLKNLTVEHYASRISDGAVMILDRDGHDPDMPNNIWIENCTFQWNSANGIELNQCFAVTLRDCRMVYNGFGGMAFGGGLNVLGENLVLNYNGWRAGWGSHGAWGHGGAKLTRILDGVFRNIEAIGNNAPGFWFDIDNRNIVMEDLVVLSSRPFGLFFEISPGPFYVNGAYVGGVRNFKGRKAEDIRIAEATRVVLDDVTVVTTNHMAVTVNIKVGGRPDLTSSMQSLFEIDRPKITFQVLGDLILEDSIIARTKGGGFPLIGSDGAHSALYARQIQDFYLGSDNTFVSLPTPERMFALQPDYDQAVEKRLQDPLRVDFDTWVLEAHERDSTWSSELPEIGDYRLSALAHPDKPMTDEQKQFMKHLNSFLSFSAPLGDEGSAHTEFIPTWE